MCVHCNLKTIFVFMTKQGMEEQRELQWSGVVKVPGFLAAVCVVHTLDACIAPTVQQVLCLGQSCHHLITLAGIVFISKLIDIGKDISPSSTMILTHQP